MQLRSGRRLVYPPPAQHERRHHRQSWHSSVDRISGLPEDLLLEILARLRSPAEAARAGAVSRRWRGLWTELPELTFWCAQPLFVESALARITRPSLDLLDITLWGEWFDEEWAGQPGQVSLLIFSAVRLLPEKLTLSVLKCPLTFYNVELPCFERTSYLSLDLFGSLPITLPQSGEFTALKNLYLRSCCIDLGALVPVCPCLRILNVKDLRSVDMVIVHSLSLEEFGLKVKNYDTRRIEIAAPILKEVRLDVDVAKDFSLSFSAPMVKILRWSYSYPCIGVGFGQIWHLMSIVERELDGFHAVSLMIRSCADYGLVDVEWGIAQVIAHLPRTVFSVLELDLITEGHAFGPMMLHLLRIEPTIQRLKMVLARDKVRVPCPVNLMRTWPDLPRGK